MKESIAEEGILTETGTGHSGKVPGTDTRKTRGKGISGSSFPRWFLTGLLALGISLASSAAAVFIYDRYFATRIVAVDIKGFIATQRDLFVQGKIDDGQLKRNIESLEKAIENIPSNEVVIMGDAVVRNAKTIRP